MIILAWSVILIESVILLWAKTIIWSPAHSNKAGQRKGTNLGHKKISVLLCSHLEITACPAV
jgi:hypothetical protein